MAAPASVFGKFRLVAELGHGGMADVFLVVVHGPGGFSKLQVLKQLRASLADEPEFIGMLLDEARLAARLNHPNIVQTNEISEVQGRTFLTMEYLDGQPLHRLIHRARARDGQLAPAMHYAILADVLAGLHHAHELRDFDGSPLGVVHRDVSPQNVFVTYEGQVKVVDFGIAKAAGRATSETRAGVIKGKIAYMSPEQATGGDVDARADVYSVGVMLWEAATRTRMWKGIDDLVVLRRLIDGDVPRSPRDVAPDVPEAIDAICRRALAVDREERYATALDMQNAIEQYLASTGARPAIRDVGRLLADLFADKRVEIRNVIETKLAELRVLPASEFQPGSLTADSAATSPTSPDGDDEPPTGEVLSGVSSRMHRAETASRNRSRAVLVAAALVAVAGVGAMMVKRAAPPAPANTVALATNVAAAPLPKPITVRLNATPAAATMTFDGAPIGNPFLGTYPRDGRVHHLTVDAPGFVPVSRDVHFDDDATMELGLVRAPDAPGKASTNAASIAASSASARPSAQSTTAAGAPQRAKFEILQQDPAHQRSAPVLLSDDPYGPAKPAQ